MTNARWTIPGFVLIVLAAVLLLLRGLDRAPAAIVPATDRSGFSAERALGHLRMLIGENVAHPSGSAAQQRIAQRIIDTLAASGYAPEVQAGLQCSTLAPGCSQVSNIIAVRKGQGSGPAMMITAHYDSVPGSAAAADDGAGVATLLEIADLLAGREPLLHDVIFLFADGEESGLRGAMLFAGQHPLMKRVGFVVNLEARGVSGPSAMFETGPGNAPLIGLFGEVVRQPAANSLLYEVYRRMPNDTDFTVYRMQGATGFNFAFSRGASLYHSVRDDIAHLDPRSLQHQGDNALAVLLGAGAVPLDSLRATRDASYVDIGGRWLAAWPASWNAPLAAAALLLVVAIALWRSALRWRTVAWALLAMVAVLVFVPLAGWLLSWPLGQWPQAHPLDHPQPWPGRIALMAATLLVVCASARWFGRRAGLAASLAVGWIVLAILALIVALQVPGAAFVLLAPMLAYAVLAQVHALRHRADRTRLPLVAAGVAFALAAWTGLYQFLLADVVFGFSLSHLKVLPLLLLALPLLPLAVAQAERDSLRGPCLGLVLIVAAAAAWGWWTPAHTVDRPRGVNLVHIQEEGATPMWTLEGVGEPGSEVLEAMGFEAQKLPLLRYGVLPRDTHARPAAAIGALPPQFLVTGDVEESGSRVVRASLRSLRPSFSVWLAIPAGSPVTSVHVEGQAVVDTASEKPRVVGLHGIGQAEVQVELRMRPGVPLTLVALDIAPLPPEGEAADLLARRPATAAPLQNGDQSIALRRIGL